MANGFTQNITVHYWRLFWVTDTIDVGIRLSSERVYRLNIILHNGAFSTRLFSKSVRKWRMPEWSDDIGNLLGSCSRTAGLVLFLQIRLYWRVWRRRKKLQPNSSRDVPRLCNISSWLDRGFNSWWPITREFSVDKRSPRVTKKRLDCA